MKKVVLAGGTGFIGKNLKEKFAALGYEVIIISRDKGHVRWDQHADMVRALEGAEMLINLAGKSVDCRYNEKNKALIFSSRTETTKALGNALLACKTPPSLWINSSTATIYRHAEDRPMSEEAGEIGSGFSVEVAKQWEQSFFSFDLPQTRQIALRIAIVLGKNEGAIVPLKNLTRFGLGGKQGSGQQMFSWIHIDDLYDIILFLRDRDDLNGVFNCSSPHPVTNDAFMSSMRQAMNIKIGLPAPKWLLEIGTFILRTESELVLKSRWVIPERLEKAGYEFKYKTIDTALEAIFI